MEKEEHKLRHIELHNALDELIADFIRHTDKLPSQTSLNELMTWSFEQTENPSEIKREMEVKGGQNEKNIQS